MMKSSPVLFKYRRFKPKAITLYSIELLRKAYKREGRPPLVLNCVKPKELTPGDKHPYDHPFPNSNITIAAGGRRDRRLRMMNEALKTMDDQLYELRLQRTYDRFIERLRQKEMAEELAMRARMKSDAAAMRAYAMAQAAKDKKKGKTVTKKK